MTQVFFDVTQRGYTVFWFPAWGLVGIGAGLLFVRFRRYLRPRWLAFMPFVCTIFIALWTIVAFTLASVSYLRLSSALRSGRCSYVEGVITQFNPMPPSGKGWETFTVQGVSFKYSKYNVTPALHQTKEEGSPLREGVHVKVWYVGNDIARLEIQDSA